MNVVIGREGFPEETVRVDAGCTVGKLREVMRDRYNLREGDVLAFLVVGETPAEDSVELQHEQHVEARVSSPHPRAFEQKPEEGGAGGERHTPDMAALLPSLTPTLPDSPPPANPELEKELLEAVKSRNWNTVRVLIGQSGRAMPHAVSQALCANLLSRLESSTKAVEDEELLTMLLLQPLAEHLNIRSAEELTPLHYAARKGMKNVCTELIRGGADRECLGPLGKRPLMHAACEGHTETCIALLSRGVSLNAGGGDGCRTALSYAAEAGHRRVCEEFLKRGANVEAEDDRGYTPLIYAAIKGHIPVVRVLLKAGADVNKPSKNKCTPLLHALASEQESVALELLLIKAIAIDAVDNEGGTVLMYAARAGLQTCCARLLQTGLFGSKIRIDATDAHGSTALIVAVVAGHAAICKMMLHAGAQVNIADKVGTALYHAALTGQESLVMAFLRADAQANMETPGTKRTPLMAAAEEGHEKICLLLVHAGAKVNVSDASQLTPLMLAARHGHAHVCRALMDAGADLGTKDASEKTAAAHAEANNHAELARVLRRQGGCCVVM